MSKFLIHAYEQIYKGSGNFKRDEVIDLTDEDPSEISHELELIGEQLSLDVMEDSPEILTELQDEAKKALSVTTDDDGDEVNDIFEANLEDAKMNNVGYEIYQLNNSMSTYTLQEIVNMNPEDVIKHSTPFEL